MSRARLLAVPLAAACALGVLAAPANAAPPDSWTATGGLTAARLVGVAAPLPGDRALVAGGESTASTVLKSAEVYSAATDTWSSASDMGAARLVATATELASGKVLVAGGQTTTSSNSALNTGEVYDPASNTWTPVANTMSSKRGRHIAVRLPNGKVLIAGGNDETGTGTATADLYDPATNTFSPAASMGTARLFAGAAVLSTGRVLVAGGSTSLSSPAAPTGETYDPAVNSWLPAASFMTGGGRLSPSVAELPGGKALVAGGAPKGTTGTAATTTADVFDAATNSFTAAGNSMSSPRIGAFAIALADGRVLVAGGVPSTSNTVPANATADLFLPGSATFSPAASMTAPRVFPGSAQLDDGRVLAAGGGSRLDPTGALNSAEAYQPTTGPGPPTGLGAGPAIAAAVLTWVAPAFDGGAAVQRYRITMSPGGGTVDTPDVRLTTRVGGLHNGQAYTFTVTGINAIGLGIPSAPTSPVTPTTRILTRLTEAPVSFRAATSGPSARASARRRSPKPGTTVRFTLIEPATVTFTVEHAVRGHRRGRRCVAGRRGRRCTRFVRVRGSFRRTGKAGSNRFRFTGRIGGRKLAPGSYRLVATPREVTGTTGTAVRVGFRVKR